MKTIVLLVAALALCGCSTTTTADTAAQVLGNLEHCERTYIASIGGFGVPAGSLNIRCPARPFDAPPPADEPVT